MKLRFALLLLLAVPGVFAEDTAPSIAPEPALPEITRGQTVTVNGNNFPEGNIVVRLSTGKEKPENRIPLPATRGSDGNSLSFVLPADPNKVPAGRYLVAVDMGGKEYSVPGDLRVLADASAQIHLDAVYPVTVYPDITFEISGQNLARAPSDNSIIIDGRGPVEIGSADECEKSQKSGIYQKACLEVPRGMETRKLKVLGFPRAAYDGPISIAVRVGNNTSNSIPLTFSRVTDRTVFWAAMVVFLAIMVIVFKLTWKGVGQATVGGTRYSPWTSFFLDKETNSYSLSKLQLLLWTSVFIFGYLYLFLCRMLIQWKFELPPLPDGMPVMLAISAGTVVAAAGATEARGSKGAGPIHPSAADFISTGGLVVGERFQFFVWTLAGTFGFLAMLLLSDPSTLVKLPDIPESFLYVMGISSVGYLAGKVTRKPGPVIRGLSVANVSPPAPAVGPAPAPAGAPPQPPAAGAVVRHASMTLLLRGDNISENAIVKVGDKQLRTDQYTIKDAKHQDQAPDPAFCTELTLVLLEADDYMEGEHKLELANRDAQAASVMFPIDPMAINSVDNVRASNVASTVTVKGKNLTGPLTAQWEKGATVTLITADNVKNISSTELQVSLTPGDAGEGKFTLISPIGLRASAPVTVT